MKIVTHAKIILTVPMPAKDETPEDIVLTVERRINEHGLMLMPKTKTRVGIRIHVSGKVPEVTE